MRFGQALGEITIPEWKECYLNYEILKIFVAIIKAAVQNLQRCDQAISQLLASPPQENSLMINPSDAIVQSIPENVGPAIGPLLQLQKLRKESHEMMVEANKQFYRIFFIQMEIVQLFYQMKVLQIEDRYRVISRHKQQVFDKDKLELYLTYIEYAYVEISYLTEMREANIEAERKILKKHKKYAKKMVSTPAPDHEKITRMIPIQESYVNKIQDLYVQKNSQLQSKEAREFIRLTAHKEGPSEKQFFFSGVGVGASIVVLGTLIFIILYQGLNVENNSVFARDFPAWRGIGIFILYIWVLGFNLYCFEKYKISHRLIFKFDDHHYSTSAELFKLAGFFTTLFLAIFLIYLLSISNVLVFKGSFRSQHLVLIVYVSLFGYIFMPLPIFNHRGRIYALKLIGRCLISPVIGVDFTIVWMTDQWQSLTTPLRDLAYTFCYYSRLDFEKPKQNPCTSASTFEVALLVVIIAVSYRILQCLRLGWDKGFLCQSHMFNTIKYCFSLGSAVLAYLYKQNSALLPAWLAISIVSTIYSYAWDLKMDFGLLSLQDKNFLLRKYITFEPKRNYYIVMVINLLLRLSWTITLSPAIVSLFGDPNLVTFATGSAEIIRRGIWSLFRVELEHLANCVEFRAIPDLKDYEQILQEGVPAETAIDIRNKQHARNREIVKKEFIDLIKKKIQDRQAEEKDFNPDYEEKKLEKLKKMGKQLKKVLQKSKKNL